MTAMLVLGRVKIWKHSPGKRTYVDFLLCFTKAARPRMRKAEKKLIASMIPTHFAEWRI